MTLLPNFLNEVKTGLIIPKKLKIASLVFAILIPILLPLLHFGVISHLWDEFNYEVNVKDCSCYCWDTIFKG